MISGLRLSSLILAASVLPALAWAQPAADQMERGKKVFTTVCVACHQANAQGIPPLFPPLAKSDYLMADKKRSITIGLKGLSGKITVNGKPFDGVMPPPGLKPDQVADVLTYVRNSFGNTGDAVTLAEVEAVAKETK